MGSRRALGLFAALFVLLGQSQASAERAACSSCIALLHSAPRPGG